MRRTRRTTRALLARSWLLLVLLLAASTPVLSLAFELSPESQITAGDGGIGGTGVESDDGRGIGGTGVMADDGRGIGGTGIVGTITGFGSIFVNGFEIEVPTDLQIAIKEDRQAADALRLGQVVEVEAEGEGDSLTARSIAVRHETGGPIEAIDPQGGRMIVLGQLVEVPSGTVFSGDADDGGLASLRPGEHVDISGLRRDDGAIVASRIDRLAGPQAARLRGTVSDLDAAGFFIEGRRVDLPIRQRPADLASGQQVTVIGTPEAGRLVARQIQVAPSRPFAGRMRSLSLEGYLRSGRAGGLALGRLAIGSGPRALALRRAQRVILNGQLDDGGVFRPRLQRSPRWLQRRLQAPRGGIQNPQRPRQRLVPQLEPDESGSFHRPWRREKGGQLRPVKRPNQRLQKWPQPRAIKPAEDWPEGRQPLDPRLRRALKQRLRRN